MSRWLTACRRVPEAAADDGTNPSSGAPTTEPGARRTRTTGIERRSAGRGRGRNGTATRLQSQFLQPRVAALFHSLPSRVAAQIAPAEKQLSSRAASAATASIEKRSLRRVRKRPAPHSREARPAPPPREARSLVAHRPVYAAPSKPVVGERAPRTNHELHRLEHPEP